MVATASTARRILVDDRLGSRELVPVFKKLALPVEKRRLEFGDIAFGGNGPRGPVEIGVERKTVNDLINSFNSGRLPTHQLPGMVQTYPYRWIIVEGYWRPGPDNVIEVFKKFGEKPTKDGRGMMMVGAWYPAITQTAWSQLIGRTWNLEIEGACWVERTGGPRETVEIVGSLFRWWGKRWKDHRAHLGLEKGITPDRVLFEKPSFPRLFAGIFPGVEWTKSKAAAKHFHTIRRMANAGPREWRKVVGFGEKLSTTIPLIISGYAGERSRER